MDPVLIPCRPGTKFPLPIAKGWNTATVEEAERWWDEAPDDANVALRLDGFVMVDCDSDDLAVWFGNLVQDEGWPEPVIVRTPRGRHYYWRLDEGDHVASFVLDAPMEGDIRVKSGAGQYALIRGTTEHGSYRAMERPTGAPVAGSAVIRGLEARKGAVASQIATQGVSGGGLIPEGMRNTALTGFAGLMRRYGFDTLAIERVLVGLNGQLTEEPIPDAELASIIRSSDRWEAEELSILHINEEDGKGGGLMDLLTPDRSLRLLPPAQMLWEPYFPKGRLVLLDGDEGIGKGMLCAWAAKQVVMGEWGDGAANVLWAAAEDDPEEDIHRRLAAVGLTGTEMADVLFFNEWPAFPRNIPHVKTMIEETGAKLMILDPGRSFIHAPEGVTMSYNDESAIRPAMEALNRMAKETGCTIIFVHHWNKDSQGSIRSRAGGTKAFTQVVRHRVTVARVGQGETAEWAMEVTKSNIARDGYLRSYSLVEVPEFHTARFQVGEPIHEAESLGAWVKTREHEHNNREIAINHVDLVESSMQSGDPINRASLMNLGLSQREADRALAQLEEAGKIALVPTSGGPRKVLA